MSNATRWEAEADVVVVGFGGAGVVTAIAAHDAGAKVLVIEKQPADTPTRTNHTPSSRMCGGAWLCPSDAEKAAHYFKEMAGVANETVDAERGAMLDLFARYLLEGTDWVKSMGVPIGDVSSQSATTKSQFPNAKTVGYRTFTADFPELAGSEVCALSWAEPVGKYRQGAAFFKALSDAMQKRGIPIMWDTAIQHLVMEGGRVVGVRGMRNGKEVAVKARRAVVLTCGGFEFNEWMKENYLRVSPVHFYGTPACTGEGVTMCMEVGASLWHMNAASWRVTMKFADHPQPFGTQRHETASVFVDRLGRRFANERFKVHAFGYHLVDFDAYIPGYPKVPSFWLFDEKRRKLATIASHHGACNPPGGVPGDIYYDWSPDNQREIDRGWIMKASTLDELAAGMKADADDGGLMSASTLKATVKRYNELCRQGKDTDFGKAPEWLLPLEDPPYYAVKLWPGGPNTQGGPQRNAKGQVLRVDGSPIPGLYSAGELGSIWGMLYQGAGNLGECIAFGRISGENAALEKAKG